MTEPTIKPGTRCECRERFDTVRGADSEHISAHRNGKGEYASLNEHCPLAAVRMVTVRLPFDAEVDEYDDATGTLDLAMCEACAQWHEKRGAA